MSPLPDFNSFDHLKRRIMLRSSSRRLLPLLRCSRTIPFLTRGARIRRAVPPPSPPTHQPSASVSAQQLQPTSFKDIDEAVDQLANTDVIEVEASPDMILLDQLNTSRPGTKTDKRYKKQKALMKTLDSDAAKTRSLTEFLMKEAKRELFHYPNHDELEMEDGSRIKDSDLERGMEFEMKRLALAEWDVSNERYKRFEVLLKVLENLNNIPDQKLDVPIELLANVFELSQYLEDENLKFRARLLTGQMIYDTKRVEFDPINESMYIEALMEFNYYQEAERLLVKRAENVNQRWWYELLIVNYIDQKKLNKAEDLVNTIHERFGEYLDTRIYLLFINSYLASKNVQRTEWWTMKLQDQVAQKGFLIGESEEPGLGASEEETLAFLNREDPPRKDDFLSVITAYLKSDVMTDKATDLTTFFLSQPGVEHEDVALKLIELRYQYKTKILPFLSKLTDRSAATTLSSIFDEVRSITPIEAEQSDLMEDFFLAAAKTGNVLKITEEMKRVTESGNKLTGKHFYSLISALLKSGREEEAYTVLGNLELSQARLSESPEQSSQFIIPPVNTYHYIPFVSHYGRSRRITDLQSIMDRFHEVHGVYNPALLTQLVSTLSRNKEYTSVMQVIASIVMHDLHKMSSDSDGDYTRLYSAIWYALKDIAYAAIEEPSLRQNAEYPDYRVVFLKMIQDRVAPSPDDYAVIVRAFSVNKDYYPIPCVLQYMGKVHRVTPTAALMKSVANLEKKKGIIQEAMVPREVSMSYRQVLDEMESKRRGKKSMDPFAAAAAADEDEAMAVVERKDSVNSELLWRVALAKVLDVLEKANADEEYLKRVHEEFGLVYDMNAVFAPEK